MRGFISGFLCMTNPTLKPRPENDRGGAPSEPSTAPAKTLSAAPAPATISLSSTNLVKPDDLCAAQRLGRAHGAAPAVAVPANADAAVAETGRTSAQKGAAGSSPDAGASVDQKLSSGLKSWSSQLSELQHEAERGGLEPAAAQGATPSKPLFSRIAEWARAGRELIAGKLEQAGTAGAKAIEKGKELAGEAAATVRDCAKLAGEGIAKVWNTEGGLIAKFKAAVETAAETAEKIGERMSQGARCMLKTGCELAHAVVDVAAPFVPKALSQAAHTVIAAVEKRIEAAEDQAAVAAAMREAVCVGDNQRKNLDATVNIITNSTSAFTAVERALSMNLKMTQALEAIAEATVLSKREHMERVARSIEEARQHRAELLRQKIELLGKYPWLRGTAAAASVQLDYVDSLPEEQIVMAGMQELMEREKRRMLN